MSRKTKNERRTEETPGTSIVNIQNDLEKKGCKDTGDKRHHHCPFNMSQEKDILIDYFKTPYLSANKIGEKYKIGKQALYLILRAYNIKGKKRIGTPSKYKLDENFFNKVDTQEKAYILGLLYADGNVFNKTIMISLQEQDKAILIKMLKLFKSNSPLKFIKKKKKHWKNQHYITLYSQKLSNDLKRIGCIPNKSLILKFPTPEQVPDHLIRHFIRGYFDGDGCIYVNFEKFYKKEKYNESLKCRISIVSTYKFLNKLRKICKNKIGIKFFIRRNNDKRYPNNRITSEISLYKRNDVIKFCNWMYKNSLIHFKRKHNKYKKFIKELNNNNETLYKIQH